MTVMETKVLEKGQVVIPASLRRRLGIKSGDKLKADVKNGDIVLSPKRQRKFQTRLITDPLTGFPVLDSGPDAPVLTNEMVRDLLVDFP
jgi:AbrB family looped-hinge helix DNA binding protein